MKIITSYTTQPDTKNQHLHHRPRLYNLWSIIWFTASQKSSPAPQRASAPSPPPESRDSQKRAGQPAATRWGGSIAWRRRRQSMGCSVADSRRSRGFRGLSRLWCVSYWLGRVEGGEVEGKGKDVRKYWCMALEWSAQGSKWWAKMGNLSLKGWMWVGSS